MGNYSNRGQEWQPQQEPQKTLVHDFPDKELCKAIPYGIYDVGRNEGWVILKESLTGLAVRPISADYGAAKGILKMPTDYDGFTVEIGKAD